MVTGFPDSQFSIIGVYHTVQISARSALCWRIQRSPLYMAIKFNIMEESRVVFKRDT